MQLTLIKQDRLTATVLPHKISGQFWVEHYDFNGKKEPILSVEGNQGQWLLRAGRNATLFNQDMQDVKERTLEPGACIQIHIRKTGEQAMLLATNDSPLDSIYPKYTIANNTSLRIGSQEGNDIVLSGEFIAPLHAELHYNDGVFQLQNRDSVRGIYVNGLRTEGAVLEPGDVVYIMGISLIVGKGFVALSHQSRVVSVNGGLLGKFQVQQPVDVQREEYFDDIAVENVFYRSPRFKRDIETRNMKLDSPPQKKQEPPLPLMLSMGPSVTMGTASMMTAFFTVTNTLSSGGSIRNVMPSIIMAGSMLLGTLLWPLITKKYEKRRNRKLEKQRQKKYYAYLEQIREAIARETQKQTEILHENLIPLEDCIKRIRYRERGLWERMPEHNDFMKIRLGLGELPVDMQLSSQEERFTLEEDELADAMRMLAEAPRMLKNVPVPLSLQESYITGVIGPRDQALAFTRSMVFQLAALHSYTDLKMIFLYDESERDQWRFARWLPHTWSKDESLRFVVSCYDDLKEVSAYFDGILAEVREMQDKTVLKDRTSYVIFSTQRTLAKRTELLNQVLEMGEYAGFSVVLLYNELNHLPKECLKVVELGGADSKIYDRGDISGESQSFMPDFYPDDSAEEMAVTLANTRLEEGDTAFVLPNTLTFLEMYGVEKVEHLNPLERWRENNPVNTLKAPIGVCTSGDYFYLDLHEKYHGPHGLVAGMTGSGKSEFIMTYIQSLALNYHPYEVAFILIDYKGGGMANAFLELPHLAGTITNLDGAAVSRSLISIQSELKRRQAIFSETSKKVDISNIDIYKYQKLFRDGVVTEPVQHLFIISDEFAELKSQQPEFMQQLVSAARIGRSLGVHLILATQKPSGVVDDQIWSNSRFRICLKVQEPADSNEMIKRPDAASLSQTGRFYVQVGTNEVFELGQSAWGGAPYLPDQDKDSLRDDSVELIDHIGRTMRTIKPPRKGNQAENPPKQLDEITKHLKQLAEEEGIHIRPLWLEPIAPVIFVDKLSEKYQYQATPYLLNPIIGEYDNPEGQSQHLLTLPISKGGNAVVYGAGGNGKTTFITTVLYSLISNHTAQEVNVYIVDFGAETLRSFIDAPQVGDVVLSYEAEKLVNLFGKLQRELASRKKLFVDIGGDYDSYVKNVGGIPRIITILHNYASFNESYGDDLGDELYYLSREGAKYGINFVLTTPSPNDVRMRVLQSFGQIYCMQLNDPTDYNMVFSGMRGMIPAKHKGRGLCQLDTYYEFQTAYAADPEQVFSMMREYCKSLAAAYRGEGAPEIAVLPEVCDTEYMTAHLRQSGGKIPLGVDKASLEVQYSPGTAYATFVCYDTAEAAPFVQGLADLCCQTGAQVQVIDLSERFESPAGYRYAGGIKDVGAAVEEFFETILQRNNRYKDCLDNGDELPVFEEKIYLLHDLKGLLEGLNDDGREKVELALLHGRREYRVRVIVSGEGLAGFARTDWYARHFASDTFIWVGSGITDQYHLKINGNVQQLRQPIPDNFGYVVEKGRPKLCKLVMSGQWELEQAAVPV